MEQDWTPTVINARSKPASHNKNASINAALRGGEAVSEKKYAGGTNKKSSDVNMRKLDDETEQLHHDTVPLTLSRRIQQARQTKGMTQAQLAQLIAEKPAVVNGYEAGKAIPNNQQLGKMERALGVKLRGRAPSDAAAGGGGGGGAGAGNKSNVAKKK